MFVIEMCSVNDSGYHVIGNLPPELVRGRNKLVHIYYLYWIIKIP